MSDANRLQGLAASYQAHAEQLMVQVRTARVRQQLTAQQEQARAAAHNRHYEWARTEAQRQAAQQRAAQNRMG